MTTPGGLTVSCVAAVARHGVIGNGPDIPWRVPGEQAEFKRRTLGTTLLMGRATYASIGRPLPGRTTVVLTRDPGWSPGHDGVHVARDLDAAVSIADGLGAPVSVAGGAQVYAAALAVPGLVDAQVLTEIPLEVHGDVRYPAIDEAAWPVVERAEHEGFTVVVRWTGARLDALAALVDGPVAAPVLLRGGTHATTLAVRQGDRDLVARWFPPGDEAVARERAVLEMAPPLAPVYVIDGTTPWGPVLVTTRLAGGAPPPDAAPEELAPAMAEALAALHARDGADLPVSSAVAAPPSARSVLVHGDFWSGNLLWDGRRAVGVVDWTGACRGPAELDVAWARQDLVLLGSTEAARIFLEAYERASGVRLGDVPAWDRWAVDRAAPQVAGWATNYAGIGRPDLTGPVLVERLRRFSDSLG
ncbi:dihydrofolate reductase [Nocardioides zeae]|uniref:dihydrofolate reductase n=1 Tax=Nocardioides zeae TaxID=1457234 RepID=A0A6P0HEQ0_9ACTN|nr:dihydrofolate reductase [Nocardioides zeae]NEN77188.1 phosphotransferase [Nocardioides zeae]